MYDSPRNSTFLSGKFWSYPFFCTFRVFGAPFRHQERFSGFPFMSRMVYRFPKCALFCTFFHFLHTKILDFSLFLHFSWFCVFYVQSTCFEGYACQTVFFVFFCLFFGFWIQILDLLGLPPTWYLLASISRRKLATHIPWTLSHHGCYVASSNELDDAKTVQIFASWLTSRVQSFGLTVGHLRSCKWSLLHKTERIRCRVSSCTSRDCWQQVATLWGYLPNPCSRIAGVTRIAIRLVELKTD